jgi:ATP-dependent Clp protease adaptor protein ClpS
MSGEAAQLAGSYDMITPERMLPRLRGFCLEFFTVRSPMSQASNRSGPPFGETQPDNRPLRPVPKYRVILANDPKHGLMFVVRVVMDVMHLGQAEATQRMWEAHHNGRSQLLVTHKERAELYVEQFADRGLAVNLEPVG